MKIKQLSIIFSFIGLAACNGPEATQSQEQSKPESERPAILEKLVGTWQSEDGKSFEQWTKSQDNRYNGRAYSLNGTDTMIQEQFSVYPENGRWVFENLVSGQNDGKSVKFEAVSMKENTMQFSNPAHDFPNDIHYNLPDHQTVHAFIVGHNKEGGYDTIPFNYKRIR